MSDNTNMEKRVNNNEIAIMSMVVIIQQLLPPELSAQLDAVMEEYCDAAESLGAIENLDFHRGDK